MLEHQLAAIPAGDAYEHQPAKRQGSAPGQDDGIAMDHPQAPVGGQDAHQHETRSAMGPGFRAAPNARPGQKFRKTDERCDQPHEEAPARHPETKAHEKGIGGQPPEDVSPQRTDRKGDWEGHRHDVQGVIGDRNLRAQILGVGVLAFPVERHGEQTAPPSRGSGRARLRRAAALMLLTAATPLRAAPPLSTLHPAGDAAADTALLWWVLLAVSALILIFVIGAAILAMRRSPSDAPLPERLIFGGLGLAIPSLILAGLLGAAIVLGARWLGPRDDEVRVALVADLNGWTARHRRGADELFTRNLVVIPAGQRIEFLVTSQDVIHSFWIPRLGGKVDAIPGRTNRIRLHAREPGLLLGQCAEYCGPNHAHMQFRVLVTGPDDWGPTLARLEGATVDADPGVFTPRDPPAIAPLMAAAARLLDRLGMR